MLRCRRKTLFWTPIILEELSSVSPWEFPEIRGEDSLVGLCTGLLGDSRECCQDHMGDLSLELPEGPGKDDGWWTHKRHLSVSHLYTGILIERMNETLLGSKYSWEHSAWPDWRKTQWNLRITTHVMFFFPTGLGAFSHSFWLLSIAPHPPSWETNLLFRSGKSFVVVTIKTCGPGSHFDPVWWPCRVLLCSIRQQSYNLTPRKLLSLLLGTPSVLPSCYSQKEMGAFRNQLACVKKRACRVSGFPRVPHLVSCQPNSLFPYLQHWTLPPTATSLQSWETCPERHLRTKDMNKQFTEEEKQMTTEHLERCPTTLII